MEVLFFGQLTDITGTHRITVAAAADTVALEEMLLKQYPALQQAKYRLAVNTQMVHATVVLQGTETIALMPPFSGG